MRPDASCLCVDAGIHAGIWVSGQRRDQLLAAFYAAHRGPGHLLEDPPRDWYEKAAAFKRHLAKVRAARERSA